VGIRGSKTKQGRGCPGCRGMGGGQKTRRRKLRESSQERGTGVFKSPHRDPEMKVLVPRSMEKGVELRERQNGQNNAGEQCKKLP